MSMTDPIADMLSRIRNGQMAKLNAVQIPASTLKTAIAKVLREQGYVGEVKTVEGAKFPTIEVELKYYEGRPVISEITRVSKPGLRRYSNVHDLPRVRDGLGVAIISTSKGVMTDSDARTQRLGGEVLCTVF